MSHEEAMLEVETQVKTQRMLQVDNSDGGGYFDVANTYEEESSASKSKSRSQTPKEPTTTRPRNKQSKAVSLTG